MRRTFCDAFSRHAHFAGAFFVAHSSSGFFSSALIFIWMIKAEESMRTNILLCRVFVFIAGNHGTGTSAMKPTLFACGNTMYVGRENSEALGKVYVSELLNDNFQFRLRFFSEIKKKIPRKFCRCIRFIVKLRTSTAKNKKVPTATLP